MCSATQRDEVLISATTWKSLKAIAEVKDNAHEKHIDFHLCDKSRNSSSIEKKQRTDDCRDPGREKRGVTV